METKTAIDILKELRDARLERILKATGNWVEEVNQTTFATNEPEEGLSIAYFAEKKISKVKTNNSGQNFGYKFNNDNTIDEGNRDNITSIIVTNSEAKLEERMEYITEDLVLSVLENKEYVAETILEIPTLKIEEKETFSKLNKGFIGSDAYIVVKGFALQGKEATVYILEKEPLLTEASNHLLVGFYNNETDEEPTPMRELKATFNEGNEAIIKIKFHPGDEKTFEGWQEALTPPNQSPPTSGAVETSIRPVPRPSDLGQNQSDDQQTSQQEDGLIEIVYDAQLYLNVKVNANQQYDEEYLKQGQGFFRLQPLTGIRYDIYTDGRLEKRTLTQHKKVNYFYHDNANQLHHIDTLDFITINNVFGANYGGDTVNLLDSQRLNNYKKGNVGFGYQIASPRRYLNDNTMASVIGAMLECGFEDIVCNGFSHADGSSRPSVSHKNGYNGDFRYLRNDGTAPTASGTSLHINQNPEVFDFERQNQFINALYRFGWKSFLGWSYTLNGEVFYLDRIPKNSTNHHHHLHVQGYNPELTIIDDDET